MRWVFLWTWVLCIVSNDVSRFATNVNMIWNHKKFLDLIFHVGLLSIYHFIVIQSCCLDSDKSLLRALIMSSSLWKLTFNNSSFHSILTSKAYYLGEIRNWLESVVESPWYFLHLMILMVRKMTDVSMMRLNKKL